MADNLADSVSKLKITVEEGSVVDLGGLDVNPTASSTNLALVGKVLTIRNYNFEALKRTLNQIWTLSKEARFRRIENSLFVIQFATAKDKAKVMAGRPWTFDNHLVLLEEIEGSVQPSEISLYRCPFWLRLYNLPMDSRAEGVVRTIGGSIGDVIEVESDGIAWDKSARVKVNLDVSKPLRRIQQLKTRDGRLVVIEIKYERLPTFCYECGTIGHIERDCPMEVEEGLEEEKQWGAWLRASPRKGRMKMVEETNAFLGRSKRLVFTTPAQVGAGSRLEGSYGEGLLDVGRKETINGAHEMTGSPWKGK